MAIRKTKKTVKTNAQAVTVGTTIRMESANSKRKPKPKTSVTVVQEINPARGFVGFIREHAIVALAVGFVIATQVQTLVKQFIASFIDPLYGLLINGQKLSTKTFSLTWHGRAQQFAWGAFVYGLLDFLLVLLVLFMFIKFFNLDKLDKPKKK